MPAASVATTFTVYVEASASKFFAVLKLRTPLLRLKSDSLPPVPNAQVTAVASVAMSATPEMLFSGIDNVVVIEGAVLSTL